MHKPSRVEVAGPLAAYAIGFRRELGGRGYSRSRTTGLLLLMARLSRWLSERGRTAAELSDFGYRAVRIIDVQSVETIVS